MAGKGYDLHTHTTASDGLLSPAESVELAFRQGLDGMAVTDHDTAAGAGEAARAGKELGFEVIPGVEISTIGYGEDVHVLGLWIDPEDEQLMSRLSANRDLRRARNAAMMEKLREFGCDVHLEEAERIAAMRRGDGDASVSRPHIAELLVAKGYVSTVQEAFDVYLGSGGKAYVTVDRISPEEAIAWIREAGGVAVLAHPGLYTHDLELIDRLSGLLDGVEAAHADHDEAMEKKYRELARRYGLVATAGSDFHGLRDGVPFHAMVGSRTAGKEVIEQLQHIHRARRRQS